MEYIKNISENKVELLSLGVELDAGAEREIAEFANRSVLQNNASYLCNLVYTDKIVVLDADRAEYSKVESVQYFSNAFSKVSVVLDSTSKGKYYFLKDTFKIAKNSKVYKTFKGSVDSLHIIPTNDKLDVKLVTGDGIELPADNLTKRQTLEFDFGGRVQDLKIELTGDGGSVEVEIFMEGSSTDTAENIQRFINTWYDDMNMWQDYVEPIEVVRTINSWKWTDIVSYELDVLVIGEDKEYKNSKEFEVYSLGNNEYVIEYLEWNAWSAWNSNQFYLQVKNISAVRFDDTTVEVVNAIPWEDRKEDRRHY